MKKIFILTFVFAALAGCRNAAVDTVETNCGEFVDFCGRSASTRLDISEQEGNIVLAWQDGDTAGLFGSRNGASLGGNLSYYSVPDADDPSSCKFRPVSSGNAFRDAAAGDVYYGYLPYDRASGNDPAHVAVALPAVQYQTAVGDMSHIPTYNVMKSRAAVVAAAGDDVALEFRGVFSIVELRLRLSDGSALDEVPIKKITLTSASADMALPECELDLTSDGDAADMRCVDGSRAVTLLFDGTLPLKKQYGSFYFVVAGGAHPSEDITLEVTAVDNSVATAVLTGDVVFRPNCRYAKSAELALDDFVRSEPFDVVPSTATCRAGEPVDFVFTGAADEIAFFSGEIGHEYRYSVDGKPAKVYMNFSSLYYNGAQRKCATVKYSPDFRLEYDGTAVASTEADIENATWYDVSDRFVMPPYITNVDSEANLITDPYDSGTIDISDWFSEDNDAVTFGFFYHVEKFDAAYVDEKTGTKGNGRTWYNIYSLLASAQFDDGTEPSTLVEMKKGDHTQLEIIHGESYADEPESQHCKKNVSSGGTTVIRMQATFRAAADRFAYVVTKPIVRPRHKPDTGSTVKEAGAPQPEKYTYVFSEAGTYVVTVKGTVVTLSGHEEVIREFVITVK